MLLPVLVLILALNGQWLLSAALPEVPTPRRPVTDEYHGVRVTEDYRWLERAEDAEVREWTARQNARTRAWLDRSPLRQAIAEDLEELYEESGATYFNLQTRSNRVFVLRLRPPAQQPVLLTLRSVTNLASRSYVVDPNALDTNGTTAIDWYVPSPDGRLVAVCLSHKGSEDGSLHFFESGTGRKLADEVPRVQFPTGGGSAAWNADGTGVFYTRYPHKGERPDADLAFFQQVWFHKLGTPVSADTYEVGREFPRIAEIELQSSDDGRHVLATVANGDGGDFYHWLREPAGRWRPLTQFEDGVKRAEFGRDDHLYLLSRQGAPRGKVLRLPLAAPELAQARVFVKEGKGVIQGFAASAGGLYVQDLLGGPSQLRFFNREGRLARTVPLKPVSAVGEMTVLRDDVLLFRSVSFTEPFAYHTYDPATNKVVKTPLAGTSPVEFTDVEVVREMVKSRDGARVPLNILRRKGVRLDGRNPVLLYGYGGYGVSLTPNFDVTRRLWLDAGGVLAIANLRGGGEFGEAWHKAGNLTRKQSVFDDFIACAQWLIKHRYTRPQKLAIEGGSNGGLLVGAALTQRPELFRAAVAHVGIFDMLRVELEPNGAFNVTEFGTVQDLAQFRALHGYSPYHRVKDGTAYPAVLLATGENDGRVNPYNSRKMTARLQAATTAEDRPVLLRTTASAGHGIGSALKERIALRADVLTFLMDQLDMDLSRWLATDAIFRGPWVGAVTPTSAVVKAKLAHAGGTARLVVSSQPNLSAPVFSAPDTATAEKYHIVALPIDGLVPDRTYFYALEVDGKLEAGKWGQFRTFPAGPASFSFAFASCGRTGSTNPVYDCIRERRPLFYLNTGDFHYRDISSNNLRKYHRAYDRVLWSPPQARLYREVPLVYVWDDHDFGGNNANRRAASRPAARRAYEDFVPHYPLVFEGRDAPISQVFSAGRARFIVTDLRSQRDPVDTPESERKTMLGAKQKEWFKQQLLEARDRYPLIFWVSSVPWIGTVGTNYYPISTNLYGYIHHSKLTKPPERRKGRYPYDDDHWSAYASERRELADFIKQHDIRNLVILHGDMHSLGADDGTHADYSTGGGGPRIRVLAAAPLDQNPSVKGGPYSQGWYRVKKGEGAFGLVTVTDLGREIRVKYSGRNNRNDEKVSLEFTVPAGR